MLIDQMMEVVLLFCRPGHCLKKHGEDINPCDDEARPPSPPSCGIFFGGFILSTKATVEQTLRRLALLVKTRGAAWLAPATTEIDVSGIKPES